MTTARLQLTGITKRYPGVVANNGVSLTVAPGEIHAVLGENGAGKSTLMKIIYGSVKPDEGAVMFNGRPVHVRNPQEARALGISMVFQHFSLFDTLTVAENVWLGLDPSLSLSEVSASITAKAAEYGLDIDPDRPVHTLSVGEMQRVEIIRALLTNPQLLILDEPTSVLTPQAVDKLFVVLKKLAAEGCSILYISHKLHEIRALCNACTVLRGGHVTGVCDPRQESNASLSRLMIGAEPPALKVRALNAGADVLQVAGLTLASDDPFGTHLADMALTVRSGEVVGIAGVSGNGQSELLYCLSGETTRAPVGSIRVGGVDASRFGPDKRRALGLHFVPEERLGRGAVPTLSLAHNLLLSRRDALGAGGWIRLSALKRQAADIIARYNVKANGPDAAAKSLSGGNLQKFIVGREIEAKPKLLIVSQPTWGVDVGAAAQIRGEILALRDAGCAVLVVSEELDELFEISDRLHVIAKGRLSPSLDRADATIERIGAWMSGLWDVQAANNNKKEIAHAAA
ncbi:MAG: ABC transporter ATP-binding protein [Hydrogenophaga sp.]|uniref:ABC transporter ATP-binding protein n=1 Tax=Hydrogenophaga sp. TaxID=1904254 RepID=UPI001BC5C258|nr:ABC transporter ATP-binding protein [Hydrogenophaga sp.]MBS3911889.1 ABC transporter ATP-binding protein [Hydrogenophaga sp.]MDO9148605.1 ABC transporter ATP-binding protein [Hydrogenophaga sp.]MDO9605472.1 ABC transporter ATP-binding protein [Hydrogenophaga sp.]MDP2165861.1 ABC transporter ATP-binding protein [Hydrogenophaga sp.]MDP3475232.1 ABC transporter ATP-binding protein [Hydrogenophaga sp.]